MGLPELLVILAIFVMLFGAKRLPDLADGMGKAIRNFKRGLNTQDEDVTPPQKQVPDKSSAQDIDSASANASTAEARPAEPKS
jgi:sec-independent protein translocase protein TatA